MFDSPQLLSAYAFKAKSVSKFVQLIGYEFHSRTNKHNEQRLFILFKVIPSIAQIKTVFNRADTGTFNYSASWSGRILERLSDLGAIKGSGVIAV